jgi:hypothetical protein
VRGPTQTYDFRTKKFTFGPRTFTFTRAVRENYGGIRTTSGNMRGTVFLGAKPADTARP